MANKNYSKMSKKSIKTKDIEAETAEIVTETIEEVASEPIIGVVTNCGQLNVRKNPSKTAEIVNVLKKGEKVQIIDETPKNDFYSVSVSMSNNKIVTGYCMTDYIKIK